MNEIRFELWQRQPLDDHTGWGPYKIMYCGQVDFTGDPEDSLEVLFRLFNVRRPEDFYGHSMSIGDMVVLGETTFKCASAGWEAQALHPASQPERVDHYFV